MPRIRPCFAVIFACFPLFFSDFGHAKPQLLRAVFEEPEVPTKKGKKSKKVLPKLHQEYQLLARAKEAVDKKLSVSSVDALQKSCSFRD